MKKYFLFALMTLALTSCEEDVTDNTPAFEGLKGYEFWRATKMAATVNDGDLVIVGANDSENFTLYVDNYELGKEYTFGNSNVNVATYSKVENDTIYRYSTSSTTGKGYIKLEPADRQKPGTISGTFVAEMLPNTGSPVIKDSKVVNMNKGVFFQIPLKEATPPAPAPAKSAK